MTTEPTAPERLLRRFVDEILNEGETSRLPAFFSEDVVISPFPPDIPADRDGYALFVLMLRGAFADLHVTIDSVIVEGDNLAAQMTVTGTHTGPLADIDATGRAVSVDQIAMVRTNGERITALHSVINGFDLMDQLNASPLASAQ